VYGNEPNEFFKENIIKFPAGKLLLPGEGEGRNAVFAAKLGWNVDAFDHSEAARAKALSLAAENNVPLYYTTADLNDIILPRQNYDAIGLIYIHLEPQARKRFHLAMINALNTGGHIILQAFSKNQIHNISGGPKDENLLYDLKEVVDDFRGLNVVIARDQRVRLNEGPFHQGKADVISILATKPY
jgi:2-polyprenyl-3-methyl-5-hydroxy-6-metoxy-1,4-benzoquinol methylase